MKNISIIIPVYNESVRIINLLDSIQQIKYPRDDFEIIVVDDCSTDNILDILKKYDDIHVVSHARNSGRFETRCTGAKDATYNNLLFIDARSLVDKKILSVLDQLNRNVVIGHILGHEKETFFEIFYDSIRRMMYRKVDFSKPIELTPENFDRLPKGMGCLYIKKRIWDQATKKFTPKKGEIFSDDTKLLREVVNIEAALIHPDVKIINFGRTEFIKSVRHLFWRGPKFIDYYLSLSKSRFWLVIGIPFILLISMVAAWILIPIAIYQKLFIFLLADVIACAYLANFQEKKIYAFWVIWVILPISVITFYCGILYGIVLKLLHMKKNQVK